MNTIDEHIRKDQTEIEASQDRWRTKPARTSEDELKVVQEYKTHQP